MYGESRAKVNLQRIARIGRMVIRVMAELEWMVMVGIREEKNLRATKMRVPMGQF